MKLLFASAFVALAACQAAMAAPITPADFDLVSVVPRSPSVKPVVMPAVPREPVRQVTIRESKSVVSSR